MYRHNSIYGNNYNKYTPIYTNPNNTSILSPINTTNQCEKPTTIPNILPDPITVLQTPIIPILAEVEPNPTPKLDTNSLSFLDKNELYEFINSKFVKLDDALLSYKRQTNPPVKEIENVENKKAALEKTREVITDKLTAVKKQKRTFENVDDSLFTQVKEKYPSYPEDKKNLVVIDNDGNFYINKNKKKIPLNNINTLKLINNKK